MRSNINIRPMTPVHGTLEPGPDTPVHYITPAMRVICGVRGAAYRVNSRLLGNVTCPACLQLLNLPAPSQRPPCGATTGAAGLSADPALPRAKNPAITQSSSGNSTDSARKKQALKPGGESFDAR